VNIEVRRNGDDESDQEACSIISLSPQISMSLNIENVLVYSISILYAYVPPNPGVDGPKFALT
jgi:hypothetical protein